MGFIVSIGERCFPCPITEEDETVLAAVVGVELESKGVVEMRVNGSNPDIYIGGVARSIARGINILNGPGYNRTEVKDEQNSLGVSDKSTVVFESY